MRSLDNVSAARAVSSGFGQGGPMDRYFLVVGIVAFAALVPAGIATAQGFPAELPLNGSVASTTCGGNPNEPCSAASYPNPTVTSRFTLDQPSTVNMMLMGQPGYSPVIYLSGDGCEDGGCGSDLPAGSYCVTITADEGSAPGSCGPFTIAVATTVSDETIFNGSFDD